VADTTQQTREKSRWQNEEEEEKKCHVSGLDNDSSEN
jgi:hypothetical protein